MNCPKCGSNMVKRTANHGVYAGQEFWGCSNFPYCDGLINIPTTKDNHTVYIGSTVRFRFIPSGEEMTCTIFVLIKDAIALTGGLANTYQRSQYVVSNPGNPEAGYISDESPLGRAILGKKVGQHFSYVVNNERYEGKILEIIPQ